MEVLDVLVVEDAPEFAEVIVAVLEAAGHTVRSATSIASAERQLDAAMPELVILDLVLPDGDGLDLCRSVRERSSAYILVLTGRDDEVDKVLGLRLGADDYMTKPFSPRELAARVEALARRPRVAVADAVLRSFGELVVRPLAREAEVAGTPIDLTRTEFDLLVELTAHPRHVLTRAQLLDAVWGEGWFGDAHVVDVHIANLRKKLARASATEFIRTVRGVGYGLAT